SDGEMRTVGMIQTYMGMPVIGAHLIFEFKNDRLFVVGSTALPNVQVPLPLGSASARVMAQTAVAALADVGRPLVASVPDQPAILPLVRTSDAIEYRRVSAMQVTEPDSFGN